MSILHRLLSEQNRAPVSEKTEKASAKAPTKAKKPTPPKAPTRTLEKRETKSPTLEDKPSRRAERPPTRRRDEPSEPRPIPATATATPAYARTQRVTVLLSVPEREVLHRGAAEHGLPLSVLARKALFGEIALKRPHSEVALIEEAVEELAHMRPHIDKRSRRGRALYDGRD